MSSCVIFTDQHAPDGRVIRYNVDKASRTVAIEIEEAIQQGTLLEIPNEDGGEPLFVHPDHVASIKPTNKEDR